MKPHFALLAGVFACAGAGAAQLSAPILDAVITDRSLDEISGIAASRRSDGVYWVHNDAPRPAELVALDMHGKRRATVRIIGVRAIDWEDIASYTLDGKSWLLIGDIGDNAGMRKEYEILAIEEPALDAHATTSTVEPAWRLRFRYADGAHNVEAMAVDVTTREILLLGKRSPNPGLYSLPLGPGSGTTMVAKKLGEVVAIPAPDGEALAARFPAARMGGSVTGMDIDAQARRAIVLTYRDIWLFTRGAKQSWSDAFVGTPQRFPLPLLAAAEAIGFDRSGTMIRVSGEGRPAPWLRFEFNTEANGLRPPDRPGGLPTLISQ